VQISHFKKASADQRKNEFPLADYDVVLRKLYPSKQDLLKSASAVSADFVPSDYRRCSEFDFNIASDMEKTASAEIPAISIKPYASDVRPIVQKIYDQIDLLKSAASNARIEVNKLQSELFGHLEKLSTYFRKYPHVPFEHVEKTFYSNTKSAAVRALFNLVYDHIKGNELREKRASTDKCDYIAYDDTQEPYRTIENLLNTGELLTMAKAAASVAEADLKEYEVQAHSRLKKFVKSSGDMDKTASLPVWGIFLKNVKDSVSSGYSRKAELDAAYRRKVDSAIGDIIDPKIRAESEAAHAEAILHDFMLNDDIISSYSPHEVALAFNEISHLAPRVVQQPILVRGMLRRYLQQGHLEPVESGQITSLESDVQRLSDPPKLPTTSFSKGPDIQDILKDNKRE